jgi:hypothetical protein
VTERCLTGNQRREGGSVTEVVTIEQLLDVIVTDGPAQALGRGDYL